MKGAPLGWREMRRDQGVDILGSDTGVFAYSALPYGGLTTLTDVGMLETDRLMRDFVSVEDVAHPEPDLENIASHYYDAAKGESPSKLIPRLSRKYPSVWVVRDFVATATAKLMKDEGYSEGYVYDHDTQDGFAGLDYFPDGMEREAFYTPAGRGAEKLIKERLAWFAARRKPRQKE